MRLNRSLVLEAPTRVADGAGGYRDEWSALGTVWAAVKAGSGRELAGVEVSGPQVSYRITVRGARLFQILAVTEADQAGRHLTCFAREGMA